MTIAALAADDDRTATINVAGPAALLVAKLHKLGERRDTPGRLIDKDAHDIYRLLVATPTEALAAKLATLREDALAGAVTTTALGHLRDMFSEPDGLGSTMAGRAEALVGNPEFVAASSAALTEDLLTSLGAS
jgi:hypothetical protein